MSMNMNMEDLCSTQPIHKNETDEFIPIVDLTQNPDILINNSNTNNMNDELEKRLSNIETIQTTIIADNKRIEARLAIIEENIQMILDNNKTTEEKHLKKITHNETQIEDQCQKINQLMNNLDQIKESIRVISDLTLQVSTMSTNIFEINSEISTLKHITMPTVTDFNSKMEQIHEKVQKNREEITKYEKNTISTLKALSATLTNEKHQTDIQINALWNSITLMVQNNNLK